MLTMMWNALRGQKGQGMVEYGLILALVAVVVIGVLTAMGQGVLGNFTSINAAL